LRYRFRKVWRKPRIVRVKDGLNPSFAFFKGVKEMFDEIINEIHREAEKVKVAIEEFEREFLENFMKKEED